jgi:hypothetical protein
MAVTGEDSFVVAWLSAHDYTETLVARRFSSVDGAPIGGEFALDSNSFETGAPDIAAQADGSWLAVWTRNHDGSSPSAWGQLFAADGTAVGTLFRIDSTDTQGVDSPTVTALAGGGYVVAWSARDSADDLDAGIHARLFAADGTPLGPQFRASAAVRHGQRNPEVTALADGGFAIGWTSRGQDGEVGVFARHYSAEGEPLTPERLVGTTTSHHDDHITLAAHGNGGYAAAWMTQGHPWSISYGIAARFLTPPRISTAPAPPAPTNMTAPAAAIPCSAMAATIGCAACMATIRWPAMAGMTASRAAAAATA